MKPAYWTAPGLTRVAPEFLPQSLRDELCQLLPRDIPRSNADAFLTACARAAQFAHSWHGNTAASTRAKELREVEVRCHALLIALRGLSEDSARYLGQVEDERATAAQSSNSVGRVKVVLLGGGSGVVHERLIALWDLAAALEADADEAATRQSGGKQSRPSIAAARVLAQDLARAHLDAFGRWPAIGDGWFHDIAARLGDWRGLSCGQKLVNSVLKKYRPVPGPAAG
jgi:hypothetical protein